MLDESEFLQAVVPDITWCLGMELRPVCIGHRLTLKRLQSPFLGYPGRISYAILREAVMVLSHSHECGVRLLNSASTVLLFWLWHARLTWFGLRRVDLRQAAGLVNDHIRKSKAFNPVVIPATAAEGPCDMSTTTEWVLVTMLMQKFHMSLSEALNCPWAVAHWLHGTAAEMTGAAGLGTMHGIETAEHEADVAHERIADMIAKGVIRRG